ncbi:MAG: methyltransferase domain-containing protein [Zetaproteobacteria bacterium]|nr:methyltransferase domain-containing protein [Zetaproteobacteria bacterium]
MNLTTVTQQRLRALIRPGDCVIDATCGNGFDTLFLAQSVGELGKVYAFDLQSQAIESAQQRLQHHGVDGPALQWIAADHAQMAAHLASADAGHVRAVMFNLGYLPRSDHRCITQPSSTLAALKDAITLLAPNGVISILAYTAHAGGREECEAVKQWAMQLDSLRFAVEVVVPEMGRSSPPEWIFIEGKGG